MDITRSSLFATMLYTVLLITLFLSKGSFWGESEPVISNAAETASLIDWGHLSSITEFVGSGFANRLVVGLLVFILSVMAARTAIKRVIYLERNYMPSVLFVLICTSFNTEELSITSLVSAVLILMASSTIIKSRRYKHIASRPLLTSSFYYGLSALIFPPSIYIAPIMFVGLFMFRQRNLREFIVVVSGFLFPFVLYFIGIWASGEDILSHWQILLNSTIQSDGTISSLLWSGDLRISEYLFIGVCTILFILSNIIFIKTRKFFKKHSQLSFRFFSFFALWSVAAMLFSPCSTITLLPIMAISLSVVIPTYFASSRPTFLTNMLYVILIVSALAIHLGEYIWGNL
ncbi:MAG: hypothetical protein R3Y61_01925 [Rikenellaceae bacterium]